MASNHPRKGNNKLRQERVSRTQVDEILEFLPRETFEEFLHSCRFYRSALDLQKWLVEAQAQYASKYPENWKLITPSIKAINYWRNKMFPIGDKAKILNELTSAYIGLEYEQIVETALAQNIELCMKLMERLNREGVEEIALEQVLQQISSLQRSSSNLYKDLKAARKVMYQADSEMSGAQRIVDILLNQFKDQAGEEAIKQACIAALEQIESEIYQ